jgi:surface antigen
MMPMGEAQTMRIAGFILVAFILALFAGRSAYAGDKALLGTGMGAALGGYVGSTIGKGDGQLAATGAGVFLGGLMGHSIGSSMEHSTAGTYSSRNYAPMNAFRNYAPYQPNYVAPEYPQQEVIFIDPYPTIIEAPQQQAVYVDGGYVGVPQPPTQARLRKHRHCREFTQTIRVDGHNRESYGTACLRPDGSWQIEQR